MRKDKAPQPKDFEVRGILATRGTWALFGGLWASGRLRADRDFLVVSNPLTRVTVARSDVAQVRVIRYWLSTRAIAVGLTDGTPGRWRFALTTEDLGLTLAALRSLGWPVDDPGT